MGRITLEGIFPPLPTAFTQEQALDTGSMQANIARLCTHPLSGFLVLGSNGELVMLSEEEKTAVYHAAREAIPGDRLMLAGTGGQSTRETIILTREAARAGADAAVVLHPFYYKGQMETKALKAFYHAVAEAAEIPLIVYNMPANTGMDLSADCILEIAGHPNIVGLKDSGGDLDKMKHIIRESREGFQVLAGSAGFLLPALTLGAIGGILALANIAPKECLDIYHDFLQGNMAGAQKTQHRMMAPNLAVTRQFGVPALKLAMDQLGLYGGPARHPLQPLEASQQDQLMGILKASGIA